MPLLDAIRLSLVADISPAGRETIPGTFWHATLADRETIPGKIWHATIQYILHLDGLAEMYTSKVDEDGKIWILLGKAH